MHQQPTMTGAVTPPQHGMLMHGDDGTLYLQQFVIHFKKPFDVKAFRAAWERICARHPILRTHFHLDKRDVPIGVVTPGIPCLFKEWDWRGRKMAEAENQFETFLAADRCQRFDIGSPPLWRLNLFQLDSHDWRLVWTSHHALLDGRSRELLLREISAYYEAFSAGGDIELSTPPNYDDFSRWLERNDDDSARPYWTNLFDGYARRACLPLRDAAASRESPQESHATIQFWATEELTTALEKLADKFGITCNTLLQGAWAILLSRHAGMDDVVFGATRACRYAPVNGVKSMVGLLVNTLPVRVRVPASAHLEPWLKELRAQWVAMREYEHTPLPKVQSWCGGPLFETIVVFENSLLERTVQSLGGVFENCSVELRGLTNFPLVVAGYRGRRLKVELTYDRRRFDDTMIHRVSGHIETLLAAMVAEPNCTLSELSLLTNSERHQLLVDWNNTCKDYPRDRCIHEFFEEHAARSPDAVALVFEDQQFSYAQINTRANRLAHSLITLGVGPDVLVGICMERSPDLVVGLLGILKAGGAYMPMDPTYPQERLAFMLKDTQVPVILAQASLLEKLPPYQGQVLCLNPESPELADGHGTNPSARGNAESLAYVIYTSGSTGTPKGVAIPHRGVVRLLYGATYAQLDARQTFLLISSISFDASIFELWGALLHGARCVVFAERIPTIQSLGRAISRYQVTTLFLTTSFFNTIVDEEPHVLQGISQLITGGEASSPGHIRKAQRALPGTRLINAYGPTETTTFACCHPIPNPLPESRASVPIGRPIQNTRIYLVDANGAPVPVGVTGELLIGGDGLARGYLNRPELTAEKFIPDRFTMVPGARLYRTGDLARYLPDGTIEFVGRIDNQIKIRGFRVEPGEIEAVLRFHHAVREVVIVARDDGTSAKCLMAFVTLKNGSPPDVTELRDYAKSKLPEFMVPASFVILERMPLTKNGKLDRTALAISDSNDRNGEPLTEPQTDVEKLVTEICRRVLRVERLGIHDNFFSMGGNSLLAMQAVFQLQRELGIDIPVARLFQAPTVASLAASLTPLESGKTTAGPISLIPVPRSRDFPLLHGQRSLWNVCQEYPRTSALNVCRAHRLQGPLQVSALHDALEELVNRHEGLRSTYHDTGHGPVQRPGPRCRPDLPIIDLQGPDAAAGLAEAQRIFDEEVERVQPVDRGLMLRAVMVRLDEEDHVLVLTLHHIATDGASMSILYRELQMLYNAFERGTPAALPEMRLQPADIAHWSRLPPYSDVVHADLEYWRRQLKGAPKAPEPLPWDGPPPAAGDFRRVRESILIPRPVIDAFRTLAQAEGCTLSMALFAALNAQIHILTGQDDLLIGSQLAARTRLELEPLVSCIRQRVVYRTDLSGRPTFRELLARVRRTCSDAYAHQEAAQDLIFPNATPDHPANWANIKVVFNFVDRSVYQLALNGIAVKALERRFPATYIPLNLDVVELEEGLKMAMSFTPGLYTPERIRTFLADYQALLQRLVKTPDERIIQNGNLDRTTLAISDSIDRGTEPLAKPRTELEKRLAEISRRVLRVQHLGIHDNFFSMGGNSLLAMQAAFQLQRELGIDIPVAQLFEAPTVASLAASLSPLKSRKTTAQPISLSSVPRGGDFPLLHGQGAMWDLSQKHPRTSALNVCRAHRLQGPLRVSALHDALEELVNRHEGLRSTYIETSNGPVQRPGPRCRPDLPIFDVQGPDATARLVEAQRIFDEEAERVQPLDRGLMLRAVLIRLGEEDHVLVLTLHHITTDGSSMSNFYRELQLLYNAFGSGTTPALPPMVLQPADVAYWSRQPPYSDVVHADLEYWRRQLDGAPKAPDLPWDGPPPFPGDFRGARESILIPRPVLDAFRALGQAEGCTLSMALIAALNAHVHLLTGQDDILIGSQLAARTRPELEPLITCIRQRVIYRTDVSGRQTFRELLSRVRRVCGEAYAHQEGAQHLIFPNAPLDHPTNWANIRFVFNFVDRSAYLLALNGLVVNSLERGSPATILPLNLDLVELEDGLKVAMRFRLGLYAPERIRAFLAEYRSLLQRFVQAPDARITSLPHDHND